DRLHRGVHVPADEDDPIALLDRALAPVIEAEPLEAKLRQVQRHGGLDTAPQDATDPLALARRGLQQGVITAREFEQITAARALTARDIRVDDFPPDLS